MRGLLLRCRTPYPHDLLLCFPNAVPFDTTLPLLFLLSGVPSPFFSACFYSSFQTWMEHDLGPNQHLLEASLALSPRPCELGDCTQCSSSVLRNNLWIAVTILLGTLADCRLPEDRGFVLLISLLDEFARRLGILGALHRSLVYTWQFTLGLHYTLRAPHRVVWRIY